MEKDRTELRELDLQAARELGQTLQPVGDRDMGAEWLALLEWLEANESRVLPRTRAEVLAAQKDGYPGAEELLEFLESDEPLWVDLSE